MKRTISDYIAATVDYMESPRGLSASELNRHHRGYSEKADTFAAIMTATGLRKYETLTAVYAGIGPALNARRCGRVE